jgi:hypothetical protein
MNATNTKGVIITPVIILKFGGNCFAPKIEKIHSQNEEKQKQT